MRLVPRTWKGKLRALGLLPFVLLAVYLVFTVVFWSAMSFVLAALFALHGALVALVAIAFFGYVIWRRRRLAFLESEPDELLESSEDR
jgi:hypothetical protein